MFDAVLSKLVRMEEYDFIKTLSDSFGLYFNHEKPYYAQNTGQKNAENLGPNKWNQAEHYQDSREVDKVYSSDYAIQSLHRSLWNEVDYAKLSENAVETVISTLESFAVITKESFVKRIGSIISERYKSQNYGYYYSIPSHYLTKMTLEQMDKLAEY